MNQDSLQPVVELASYSNNNLSWSPELCLDLLV
ncbi:Uncharacterized [Moorella glycerini]|uniref:Uncharacterized protein n=1 Tax=Neomoorella stamsii TaxID=1266720 RepID=A0A9X7P659_9FIRM|nr:hypothetical protein MOST_17050 [Moorella stamsii]CEP66252.1 Uncharacterized [Moorella glycerini]CEP68156.1 Uncharacterized [Moorella glycerini]